MDAVLPDFLDPVLSYLFDILPSPLYSYLINFLSHCLALLTALYTLASSFISTDPLHWDAQTILPPLITVLAAYLALVSFYRTTTWILRSTIWFIKWGTILGALLAGAGWYMANINGNGIGGYGIASSLGGIILDMVNGQGQNAAAGSRSRAQSKPLPNKKPKPWESFERHREWQYQEREAGDNPNHAQEIINNIASAARRVMKDSSWWDLAKSLVEGGPGEHVDMAENVRKHPDRKSKSKGGNTRSR